MKVPAAFWEVSPEWAKMISEAKTVRELSGFRSDDDRNESGDRSIQDYNSCIVGEAWHGQFISQNGDGQECKECLDFSNRFGMIMGGEYDGKGNRKQQLVQNIKDFTDHWRDEHNPLLHLDIETEETVTVLP
jgi:hypothetical protein